MLRMQAAVLEDVRVARDILRLSIEKSASIYAGMEDIGMRVEEISHNLEILQGSMKAMKHPSSLQEIRAGVDGAACCVANILDVLGLVYQLQGMLEPDICASSSRDYLRNIRSLEEALKLLASSSELAMGWLDDLLQLLASTQNKHVFFQVTQVVKMLAELRQKPASFRHNEGVLSRAFDHLEDEYKRLLMKTALFWEPCEMEELQAVTDKLAAEGRLERCMSIYTSTRITKVRSMIQTLDIKYLEIELSSSISVQSVEDYITQWIMDVEFVVKCVLKKEYKVCRDLYQKFEAGNWKECFATIASNSGFLDILGFGSSICRCKKEALKLLKLLNLFSALDRLRLDFNELFNGEFCAVIRTQTRALIKQVVNCISETFLELKMQLVLQSEHHAPPNGSVAWPVLFQPEYCKHLLEDENCSILIRALEIHHDWYGSKLNDDFVKNEIQSITEALEKNLEIWAQQCNDKEFSYLFMMNNRRHLHKNVKGSKLEEVLGTSWQGPPEKSMEHYPERYMKESWKKLPLVCNEGMIQFHSARAVGRNLVKKRVNAFCTAFQSVRKWQSESVISDQALSRKLKKLAFEPVVPQLKGYLKKFLPGIVQYSHTKNEIKDNPQDLEEFGSLHEPKDGGSRNCKVVVSITGFSE